MSKYIPSSVKGVLEMSRLHIDASGRVSPSGVRGCDSSLKSERHSREDGNLMFERGLQRLIQNVIPVKTGIHMLYRE